MFILSIRPQVSSRRKLGRFFGKTITQAAKKAASRLFSFRSYREATGVYTNSSGDKLEFEMVYYHQKKCKLNPTHIFKFEAKRIKLHTPVVIHPSGHRVEFKYRIELKRKDGINISQNSGDEYSLDMEKESMEINDSHDSMYVEV